MLVIRLTRTGKIHAPHYRIVVQEKRSKLNGKVVDSIGHYHPAQAVKSVFVDKEKADHWLKLGAQTSDTVTNIFVKEGILDKKHKVLHFYTPKPKEEKVREEKKPVAEEVVEETATPNLEAEVAANEPATEEITETAEPAVEEAENKVIPEEVSHVEEELVETPEETSEAKIQTEEAVPEVEEAPAKK